MADTAQTPFGMSFDALLAQAEQENAGGMNFDRVADAPNSMPAPTPQNTSPLGSVNPAPQAPQNVSPLGSVNQTPQTQAPQNVSPLGSVNPAPQAPVGGIGTPQPTKTGFDALVAEAQAASAKTAAPVPKEALAEPAKAVETSAPVTEQPKAAETSAPVTEQPKAAETPAPAPSKPEEPKGVEGAMNPPEESAVEPKAEEASTPAVEPKAEEASTPAAEPKAEETSKPAAKTKRTRKSKKAEEATAEPPEDITENFRVDIFGTGTTDPAENAVIQKLFTPEEIASIREAIQNFWARELKRGLVNAMKELQNEFGK